LDATGEARAARHCTRTACIPNSFLVPHPWRLTKRGMECVHARARRPR
jgi:hypothetical protein